ncbi:cytidine deaminase-like protein [Catenaria anguillulae PL171]|uniref:Cytidine deaminase-like protein n=1 Tax=Catenaria anguillulae PL171 TaxID=765915 RepID=A0A1Y2HW76_9FUNG|nr:cytidine deaminase-like protein [Catenaria anguillulae PL171]
MSTHSRTDSPGAGPASDAQAQAQADRYWLNYAVQLAHRSVPSPSAYCVGAVLVATINTTRTCSASGYSRELPGNTHAEEVCYVKIQRGMTNPHVDPAAGVTDADYTWSDQFARFVTLYTTMEPCSERLSGRGPCTKHSLALGVRRVVMGIAEPQDIFVKCTGVSTLMDAGVAVVVVEGMEDECWAPNRHIRPTYKA